MIRHKVEAMGVEMIVSKHPNDEHEKYYNIAGKLVLDLNNTTIEEYRAALFLSGSTGVIEAEVA